MSQDSSSVLPPFISLLFAVLCYRRTVSAPTTKYVLYFQNILQIIQREGPPVSVTAPIQKEGLLILFWYRRQAHHEDATCDKSSQVVSGMRATAFFVDACTERPPVVVRTLSFFFENSPPLYSLAYNVYRHTFRWIQQPNMTT
jgi:hypothetical protein